MGTEDGWAYHVGDDADERMTAAARRRDIHLTSKSRPLQPEDFQNFDYIIGMDHENSKAIKKAAEHWRDDLHKPLPENWQDKVTVSGCYRFTFSQECQKTESLAVHMGLSLLLKDQTVSFCSGAAHEHLFDES